MWSAHSPILQGLFSLSFLLTFLKNALESAILFVPVPLPISHCTSNKQLHLFDVGCSSDLGLTTVA